MDNKDQKLKFRQYLIQNVETRLGARFDSLNATDRAKEVARFYVKSVLAKFHPRSRAGYR